MKNSLKEFSRKHRVIATISSIMASVFIVAGLVAATSIGDNISVTGTSTLSSTTIASNLTVTSIYASSTGRFTGALTLDTALTVANGGTGAATLTDIVLGNGTSAFTATSTLTVSKGGTGVASFTATDLLIGNDTGNILSTSTLAVNKGGTGASTFTANAVLVGNGTGVITTAATSSVGTATSTPSEEFNVTGDQFVASSGTTTLFMDSTTAENGTCIQMKSTQGPVRAIVTMAGAVPTWSLALGSCK